MRASARCVFVAALFAAPLAGCAQRSRSAKDFVPKGDQALTAIRTVLNAWQSGDTDDEFVDGEFVYRLVDSRRDKGAPLHGFDIVGEVPGDRGRWFEVDLQSAQSTAPLRVKYVVVGIRPLWIFREEDYDMLSHWDHTMAPAKPQ